MTVRQLRYALERLDGQDRVVEVSYDAGCASGEVTSWRVEGDRVLLELE